MRHFKGIGLIAILGTAAALAAQCGPGIDQFSPPVPVVEVDPDNCEAWPLVYTSKRSLDAEDDVNGPNFTRNAWSGLSDATAQEPLTELTAAAADVTAVAVSEDGETVSFLSSRALGGGNAANTNEVVNVWVMSGDGSSPTPLTSLTVANSGSDEIDISPDGSMIAYSSSRDLDGVTDGPNTNETKNIWVIGSDGTGNLALTNLTADGADSFSPRFSPDGSQIVYQSSRTLDGLNAAANTALGIWKIDVDGSDNVALTNLTAAGADSFTPVFSPDGDRVAYSSSRALDTTDAANTNAVRNIWIMDSDGDNPTPLTEFTADNADSFDPSFDPDGSRVAFSSRRTLGTTDAANTNLVRNIWLAGSSGGGLRALTQLTENGAHSFAPRFSPNGKSVAYHSARALDGSNDANENTTTNVWISSADGLTSTPVTEITKAVASSETPLFAGPCAR